METEIEGYDLDLGNNGKQRKVWNSWRMCAEIHIMSVTLLVQPPTSYSTSLSLISLQYTCCNYILEGTKAYQL